jgi:GT2 family glycosyltransferase
MSATNTRVQPRDLNLTAFGNRFPSVELSGARPNVKGKFVHVGEEKIYLRGVTYGPFRPDEDGDLYHTREVVEKDFSAMVANNINAIRVYTVPPAWLLEIAHECGLWVMVGLEWDQYLTFLDYPEIPKIIERKIRSGVQACVGSPAVLSYALGNEIPASIVRWYGRRKVERFLYRLYRIVKDEDPDSLVTYVNYPTTEYLQLPFIDFVSFNVYLEAQDRLEAYLARLQNIAGNRPLVMTEIGLDSQKNSEQVQASSLEWQIKTSFTAGCAGAFVFSWTDEWSRGGQEIEDWDFGLTRRDRSPKPALESICRAFSEVPFPQDIDWPSISVVLCSHNGEETIRDACEALNRLDYPDYEVIVVNDGSTDATPEIVKGYGFRLINTTNRGLSSARNLGMESAGGEIIAYLDDDAYPDPHWLKYLAVAFLGKNYGGLGGPNISPAGDGFIADSVSNAPGNPTHILLTDQDAEHIPGCNMAFRKSALQEVGGFDPRFRIAGDDIDVCWRLQEQGWKLGFNPAAMVWHHRRNSVMAFLRQQLNYGKAEGLLERKWPEKYNAYGHLDWQGKLYGNGVTHQPWFGKWRVYHGVWGSRYFQSIYESKPDSLFSIALMPEWYLVIFTLMILSALGTLWHSLYYALPLLGLAIFPPLLQSIQGAFRASCTNQTRSGSARLRSSLLTGILHILQPLARLCGRMSIGLTPWRRHSFKSFSNPWPRIDSAWSQTWQASEQRLEEIESVLCKDGNVVLRGGEFDRWDLEIRGGLFGSIRMLMAIELHSHGEQLLRFRSWPKLSTSGVAILLLSSIPSALAAMDQAWPAVVLLGTIAFLLVLRAFGDCASSMAAWLRELEHIRRSEKNKLDV